ncbi:hypothetical protein ABIC45_004698 [Mucilaginibacter rubeus]|uniref:hypothetical protein n=1 Tax=Mucilaginibacter rubeus TaxID=2027860 RepID=UPI0033985565
MILKKNDGYYCNATDCFTEFLTVGDSANKQPAGFRLNLNAKMRSTAEYESAYYRANGAFSSNYNKYDSETSLGVEGGPMLNLSYIISDKGKKAYKFWLLDSWIQDGVSYYRGMDRFVFEPGIGIIGAAYEFFMRDLSTYWYHITEAPPKIVKGSADDKGFYPITPYFPKSDLALFDYLTESVINYINIEKL